MKGLNEIALKMLLTGTVILSAILFFQLPTQAGGQYTNVVTYNLYLGAEIQSLAGAGSLDEFVAGVKEALDQVKANDFSERAEAIAAVIVEKNPHIIGLQEVYKFTSYGGSNGKAPFFDYLEELKDAWEEGKYSEVLSVFSVSP